MNEDNEETGCASIEAITMYQTKDGKRFLTQAEALKHLENIAASALRKMLSHAAMQLPMSDESRIIEYALANRETLIAALNY